MLRRLLERLKDRFRSRRSLFKARLRDKVPPHVLELLLEMAEQDNLSRPVVRSTSSNPESSGRETESSVATATDQTANDQLSTVGPDTTLTDRLRQALFDCVARHGTNINIIVVFNDKDLYGCKTQNMAEQAVLVRPQIYQLASQVWRLWIMLTIQLCEELIAPELPDVSYLSLAISTGRAQLANPPDWASMSPKQCAIALQKKKNSFAAVFATIQAVMVAVAPLSSVVWEIPPRVTEICKTLSPALEQSQDSAVDIMFGAMKSLSVMISDIMYLMRHPQSSQTLSAMASLPCRSDVLRKIVDSASPVRTLYGTVHRLLEDLPSEDRSCSICFTNWDTITDQIAEVCKDFKMEQDGTMAKWLWVSDDGVTLVVEPGYENVPVKMDCGHVFCAGCIETLFQSEDGALQCPYRDQQYGVQRSKVVTEIEKIRKEWHEGRRLEGKVQPRAIMSKD